jgi:hypothetical protein
MGSFAELAGAQRYNTSVVIDHTGDVVAAYRKVHLFGWEDGEYRLHLADRASSQAIKIDLHPAHLITRGVKKLYFVAQQVKAIIYSLFAWEEGEFRLHFTDRAAEQAIKIDLHPAHLITRGIKKLYKPERLFRLLSPEDRLIPTPQPAFGLHEVELEKWEAELLPRVDGTRPVAELVALARRPEQTVYGFLYGLVALKILERR